MKVNHNYSVQMKKDSVAWNKNKLKNLEIYHRSCYVKSQLEDALSSINQTIKDLKKTEEIKALLKEMK